MFNRKRNIGARTRISRVCRLKLDTSRFTKNNSTLVASVKGHFPYSLPKSARKDFAAYHESRIRSCGKRAWIIDHFYTRHTRSNFTTRRAGEEGGGLSPPPSYKTRRGGLILCVIFWERAIPVCT